MLFGNVEQKLTEDIRPKIFQTIQNNIFSFEITSSESGVLAGILATEEEAKTIGIEITWKAAEGESVYPGSCVLRGRGTPVQIARAEDILLGCLGKPSGVATAATKALQAAQGRIRVVCGAWKKVVPRTRDVLRNAVSAAGIGTRLLDEPFVYIDKNYVRMFGSISRAVTTIRAEFPDRKVVLQIRGESGVIAAEAEEAVRAGAHVVMVDTGRLEDLISVVSALKANGAREFVKVAFAGDVRIRDIPAIAEAEADIVDVGRDIVDARMLDFRLDVTRR